MSKRKELLFIVIGLISLVMVVGFVVYAINFLLKNVSLALNPDSAQSQEIIRFNLEELKKLGIMQ